jgi:hypothetical protein
MLYSQYGSGVSVRVGRGVTVDVTVIVGTRVCVSVADGIEVAVGSVLSLQLARKTAKSTINRSVYFMETQLYPGAV